MIGRSIGPGLHSVAACQRYKDTLCGFIIGVEGISIHKVSGDGWSRIHSLKPC